MAEGNVTDADTTTQHVVDLKVARLDYIFSPRGLPLVRKDPAVDQVTMTLLVRGHAGGGKTTLALALAHAVARDTGGVAIYLSTEALAAELRFKTRFLGLDEGTVRGWKRRASAAPGTILTQHVELTEPGQTAAGAGARRLAALRSVDSMLAEHADEPGPPVRVVVLDGFTLPDASPEPLDLRHELVAFAQDLEARGITPMIVEEVGEHGFEWLPFIVDLVFEVGLDRDPDTGKLIRRLRCPKSRYAVCRPGPHDYGLENRRLALWPDPLETLAADASAAPGITTPPPDFFWPDDREDRYYLLSGPGVVASYYDEPSANILRPHLHTAGTTTLKVYCGAESRLERDGKTVATVGESDGPYALAWAVLEHGRDCNFISIGQMPGLMRRSRFRLPLLHMLEALARAGKRVCVHGSRHDLSNTDNLGAVLLPLLRHPSRERRTMQRPDLLTIGRWWDFHSLFAVEPAGNKDLQAAPLLDQAADLFIRAGTAELAEMHRDLLVWGDDDLRIATAPGQVAVYLTANDGVSATLASAAHLALILHRRGDLDVALTNLRHIRRWAARDPDPILLSYLAWIHVQVGQHWQAAEITAGLLKADKVDPLDRTLWACLRAIYAPTPASVAALRTMVDTLSAPHRMLVSGSVARALYAVEGLDPAVRWLESHVQSFRQSHPHMIAEAALSTSNLESQIYGLDLMQDTETTLEREVEYLYNIGVAASRLGRPEVALQAFKLALERPSLLAPYIRSRILRLPVPHNVVHA